MLHEECLFCDGMGVVDNNEGKIVDCDKCLNGHGHADENKKVYVNVYKITRHFGGHEEGGWYWNNFECLECVPTKNKYSDDIAEELEQEYAHIKRGNIYSVLGGAEVTVIIENERCQSETREVPVYE